MSKSPLLRKRALDALLDTMTTDNYQSLGGHGMDQGEAPPDGRTAPGGTSGLRPAQTPEDKGTEPGSLHDQAVIIPPKDLTPPSGVSDAEFFKESEPKFSAKRKLLAPKKQKNLSPSYDDDSSWVLDNDFGGLVLADGSKYAIAEEDTNTDGYAHDELAKRLGFGDYRSALMRGAIRVDLNQGVTGFEFQKLNDNTRRLLKDLLPDAPSTMPILIEWWEPKHGSEEFRTWDEATEWLERPTARVAVRLHRRPSNRRFMNLCEEIAKKHPDWDSSQIEAQATLVSLGVKPIEDVLEEVQSDKEAREMVPIEKDRSEHEFYKEAPRTASASVEEEQRAILEQYDFFPSVVGQGDPQDEETRWTEWHRRTKRGHLPSIIRVFPNGTWSSFTGSTRLGFGEDAQTLKAHLVENYGEALNTHSGSKIAHGQYKDTGEYDFEHEAHVREEAKQWSQYAELDDNTEDIKPYDPNGNYLCGTCDMRRGTESCARVAGDISFEKGSCRLYHIGQQETDPVMLKPFTKQEANYGEHKGGFGCHRCEYGSEAKAPDPDGRDSWCSFWGMHIDKNACCAEWDEDAEKDKAAEEENKEIEKQRKKEAAKPKVLYHVTPTDKVSSIKAKGILPLQPSNWIKGPQGERYGEGEIFAMDNATDAVRWAAKMDWEFNQQMGSGKISIIVFKPGKEKWEIDDADPMSQATNKGHWLKAIGKIPPAQLISSHVLQPDMVKSVVQGQNIKLSHGLFEAELEKYADVPTKSYGMGTPIGGTDNPDAGASDEPDEMQDPGELSLNMTSAARAHYYHATPSKNIDSIVAKGLIPSEEPQWGGQLGQLSYGKVFFADSPRQAMYYGMVVFRDTLSATGQAHIPICLRVPSTIQLKTGVMEINHIRDVQPGQDFGDFDEAWTEQAIPANQIEMWWHGKWQPIKSGYWDEMVVRVNEEEGVVEDWEGAPIGNSLQQAEKDVAKIVMPKVALVEINETSRMLPPRNDLKDHLDEQMKDQMNKEVMFGVRPKLNEPRKKKRPQIDPRINPDGVIAAEEDKDFSMMGKTGPFYRIDTMRPEDVAAYHGKRFADAVKEGKKVTVYRAGKPGETLTPGTFLSADKRVAQSYQHEGTESFGGPEIYRYEVDPADLLHVENFEASELVYKPREPKNPFADIDPDVMGPQRHALPRVKRRSGERQLISPNDRARKASDEDVKTYTPEQVLAYAKNIFGTTSDPKAAGFIMPDGSMIKWQGTHHDMGAEAMRMGTEEKFPRWVSEVGIDGDELQQFVNYTGAVRIAWAPDYAMGKSGERFDGLYLNPSEKGVTDAQRQTIRRIVGKTRPNVLIEAFTGAGYRPHVEAQAVLVSQIDKMLDKAVGKTASKTAEYSQQDWEQDETTEVWLDSIRESEDEAKRYFMQEDYLQQEAQDRNCTMDELWDLMGEEYTAEFYGYPYRRTPDFTDAKS